MTFATRLTQKDLPLGVVVGLFVACYLPFLGKPFHIDDPLYLWAARQILEKPLDFYGFPVHWYVFKAPMAEVMKNPPLASYLIAGATLVAGWSEVALHLAFLLPAVGALVGTFFLARELTSRPGVAALIMALTPVFLVSSTTVMCDVLMLCAWVWSLWCWTVGLRTRRHALLGAGALLAAVAALSKYFGMSLIPLLLAYSLLRERRVGSWLAWLALPVAILAGYQALTQALYGRGLLLDAASYATEFRATRSWALGTKGLTALIFTGGCCAPVAFFGRRLWSARTLAVAAALAVVAAVALATLGRIGILQLAGPEGVRWLALAQCAVLLVVGMGVVALAAADALGHRDAPAALLLLWSGGTLLFAFALNWSINARSLLPLAPALGILVARRMDWVEDDPVTASPWRRWWPVAPAMGLALLVAQADQRLAETSRDAARGLSASLAGAAPTVWFQGHWGFQYYAEQAGLRPLDFGSSSIQPGDLIISPVGNTNVQELNPRAVEPVSAFRWAPLPWLTTMSGPLGAGFYSDLWGPLPFAFGEVPAEEYRVYRVRARPGG